jgi:hypothetical protein
LYLQPHSLEDLQARIKAEVLANPPLLYEPEEAAAQAAAEAVKEAQAAKDRPELFDVVVPFNPQVTCMYVRTVPQLEGLMPTRFGAMRVWLPNAFTCQSNQLHVLLVLL